MVGVDSGLRHDAHLLGIDRARNLRALAEAFGEVAQEVPDDGRILPPESGSLWSSQGALDRAQWPGMLDPGRFLIETCIQLPANHVNSSMSLQRSDFMKFRIYGTKNSVLAAPDTS